MYFRYNLCSRIARFFSYVVKSIYFLSQHFYIHICILSLHLPGEVSKDVLSIEAVDSGILREVRPISIEHLFPRVE